MTDHSLALQKSIFDVLSAASVAGGRIYDKSGPTAINPYVSFGPSDETEDDADCIEGSTVSQQLDVWSTYSGGFKEAREIAAQIKALLHRQNIVMTGARLVEVTVPSIRFLRDPDGITSHAAIEVRALIESE